jgi:predicted phosphodiesterase
MESEKMDTDAVPVLDVDGSVLLFGGPYSNLDATRAVLEAAGRLGLSPGQIICTGDVVAYCADAAATVALVRQSGIAVVMGNCEESLGSAAGDCGCGFAAGSACDRLSAAWYAYADAMLDPGSRAWMRGLPRRIDLIVGGHRLAVVHGTPERINAFVFASAPDAELRRHLVASRCDGIIGGHCGIPFTRIVDGRLWHNPGAVGLPANDGTPRTWFSLLAPRGGAIEIRHVSLDYDHAAAAAAMRAARLPPAYADALETGLWPSCDVLPPDERAQRGHALVFTSLRWPEEPQAIGPQS